MLVQLAVQLGGFRLVEKNLRGQEHCCRLKYLQAHLWSNIRGITAAGLLVLSVPDKTRVLDSFKVDHREDFEWAISTKHQGNIKKDLGH